MHKFIPYAALFVVVGLLQALFFNNLGISVYLSPLVYIAFILLIPLQASHFGLLMGGLVLGVAMDMAMGVGGINTISTLFIAFTRPYILNLVAKKESISGGGVPSGVLLGDGVFFSYLILMVAIHHAIFFGFEALSLANIKLYTLRFLVSGTISALFIWLIARAFLAITLNRRV